MKKVRTVYKYNIMNSTIRSLSACLPNLVWTCDGLGIPKLISGFNMKRSIQKFLVQYQLRCLKKASNKEFYIFKYKILTE